ncbi:MAG: type II secretion system GspH family protein, partial [Fimbriimonadales bacterium]|nr:type II secretion system GspH family protein [Fimbriimonadales bacterium]
LQGFTLVEMLTVIAIMAILITIITVPLIQGFRLTRTAVAYSEVQERSRAILDQLTKELSTAALVLDNTAPAAGLDIELPLKNRTTGDFDGRYGKVRIHGGKIDYVLPARGDPANPQFNPGRNRVDPTLRAPIGQVIVPVAPGQTLVRWWVGLRVPVRPNGQGGHYVNPWTPVLAGADGTVPGLTDENLYVLYRAEVMPYVWNAQQNRYVPNTAFFAVDSNGRVVLDDPGFFIWDRDPSEIPDGDLNAHRQRLQNWKAVGRIMVQERRTDLLLPLINESTGEAIYDPYDATHDIPRVRLLLVFQPLRVDFEPATGSDVVRSGIEVLDNEQRVAPEYYETRLGSWTKDTLIRFYTDDPRTAPYYIARWRRPTGGALENFRMEMVLFDPARHQNEYQDGIVYFRLSDYLEASALNPNVSLASFFQFGAPVLTAPRLVLFRPDPVKGRILMGFPVQQALGYVPSVGTSVVNGNFTGWTSSSTAQTYDPGGSLARRFIDLRSLLPLTSQHFNPLGTAFFAFDLRYIRIVPGSEEVIGPDQRPGPNFGRPIRYSRASPGQDVGINQYKINYTDIEEPSDYMTALGVPNPNVNDDVRRYIQPRFKRGYVEFYSDPNLPLPTGNIVVRFDFQTNTPTDVVTVDYNTVQQLQVELTLRRYPSAAPSEPQAVTVKEVVNIRNFQR